MFNYHSVSSDSLSTHLPSDNVDSIVSILYTGTLIFEKEVKGRVIRNL